MQSGSFTSYALKQLKEIHQLSRHINGPESKKHLDQLCQLITSHASEIRMLRAKGDAHYLVETGDLIILCLEILIENNQSPDRILSRCYDRYKKKLTTLLKEGMS